MSRGEVWKEATALARAIELAVARREDFGAAEPSSAKGRFAVRRTNADVRAPLTPPLTLP